MSNSIEGVDDETLSDIIFELGQKASRISWTDEEHAEQYRAVALFLRNQKNVECEECGEQKEYVDEPMMSGFRGYLCTNDDCVFDS